ncbi:unnamed protein product, partial [Mycena citricolor]
QGGTNLLPFYFTFSSLSRHDCLFFSSVLRAMSYPFKNTQYHAVGNNNDYGNAGYTAPQGGYSDFANQNGSNNNSNTYSAFEHTDSYAPFATAKSTSRKKYGVIGGSVVALIIVIAVGVGVGVAVSHNHKNTSAASSSKSSNSSSAQPSGIPSTISVTNVTGLIHWTDPNDPSTFVKDDRLHQSFYGFAYTPYGSQLPSCGNSLDQVIADIQILSQLTKRIRLYGSDCNQTALVLEAIKQTKVDMKVFLGNYPSLSDGGVAYARQRDTMQSALQTYGSTNVAGITVGNEVILNYLTDNGGSQQDPNGLVGNQAATLLLVNITDTKAMVQSLGLTIPVGNSDAGSYSNNLILAQVDYFMANVHPWFANTAIADAASWTADFFTSTDVAAVNGVSNKPTAYIAETGWPTNSSSAAAKTNGAADASVANLQIFLDTFVCASNTNGTGYFFFEYFDEGWKDAQFGGVEGWWGVFHAKFVIPHRATYFSHSRLSSRTMKDVTIPTCTLS